MVLTAEKEKEYLQAGLTPDEITLITAPLRIVAANKKGLEATRASDKYSAYVSDENRKYNEAHPKASSFPSEEQISSERQEVVVPTTEV